MTLTTEKYVPYWLIMHKILTFYQIDLIKCVSNLCSRKNYCTTQKYEWTIPYTIMCISKYCKGFLYTGLNLSVGFCLLL